MNALHPTPAPTQIRLPTLPAAFPTTRDTIHRVAAHILGRRRYALSGKFGLRATPGGIGTPAFGPDYEVVRITATVVVCERTGAATRTTSLDLRTATLLHAATLVGVDLSQGFAVGQGTPSLGDPSTPLEIDAAAAHALAEWFRYGWAVLDAVLAAVSPHTQPTVIQLWPEHFDAAFDLAVTGERRTNLGASPGDNYCPQPYLYVGPWDGKRPSGSSYWNAPFGAVLSYDELRASEHAVAAGVAFLQRGIDLLTS